MTRTSTLLSFPSQVSPPEFAISGLRPHVILGVDVVALPVLPAEAEDGSVLLGPGAAELGDALDVDLLGALEVSRATGAVGEVVSVAVPLGAPDNAGLRLVLLVGVGAQRPVDFRRAGAALARAVHDRQAVATTIPALDPTALSAFVVGVMLGSFGFHWRSTAPESVPVPRVVLADLAGTAEQALELRRAIAVGGAGWRSRMLASVPSNLKNPAWLADQARELAGEAGLDLRIWDEGELEAGGFGGIVAVGKASATPPRLIRLDYTPSKSARAAAGTSARKTPTVVLVGKGITFDTGGLSIKSGETMVNMKRDMTGGAVVLATMAALAEVGCPVRVVGLVPAAENAISGNSMRPGDVVRHYGGRTSEVTNTDAEGRLVLADALAYAIAEIEPDVVVDVATLTGAMKVALGQQVGGFFANDDALAATLFDSAEEAGEPLWRFPLYAGYEDRLASKVADADNAAGGAGAITAALFLQHFVGSTPWAHLDIASTGDAPEDNYEWSKGPTGFGARALLAWLARPNPLEGVR
ncbi:leucyl aminopeptidase [Nocardioides szechwanensis]|uniref:Probable cytosol aminopeptidase n=1 Tax=Nocardioides szechwanensis TaxID=1005944 RepID=A0A1H0AJJ3_9ACTN|nr:leucyl aminopeptidase family protein [Nocardioides szechwanensis]GEP34842.1 leucyl aminopeptidase [Nocardioides szechwanensis]SDN33494.1 leucyl aminopeptidase [Nocardioides szechwanensis]